MSIQFAGRAFMTQAQYTEALTNNRLSQTDFVFRAPQGDQMVVSSDSAGTNHRTALETLLARAGAGSPAHLQIIQKVASDFTNPAILNTQPEIDEYVRRFPSTEAIWHGALGTQTN